MIQRVLSHYHLPALTCIGLILFVLIFLAAVVWIFRKGSSQFYEQLVQLPLEELQPTLNAQNKNASVHPNPSEPLLGR